MVIAMANTRIKIFLPSFEEGCESLTAALVTEEHKIIITVIDTVFSGCIPFIARMAAHGYDAVCFSLISFVGMMPHADIPLFGRIVFAW